MKWTHDRILSEIRDSAEGGIAVARNMTLVTMARRRFGSWADACEAAGVVSFSRRVTPTQCVSEGCLRPSHFRQPLCLMHYTRRRRGSPVDGPVRKTRNESGVCTADGCETPSARRYCSKHYARVARHGSPDIVLPSGRVAGPGHPSWQGENVKYSALHMRLRSHRGTPQRCEHCWTTEATRFEWALNWHAAPNYVISDGGLPYSTDLDDYVRLCTPCHRTMDLRTERHPGEVVP
jgi:hypothetical protein